MASIIAGAAHTAHSTAASLLSSAQIHPGKTLPPLKVKETSPERAETVQFSGTTIIVGVPGAFTGTCSAQIPGYIDNYEAFKAKDVTGIYVVAVNDQFVMNAWKEKLAPKDRYVMIVKNHEVASVAVEEDSGKVTITDAKTILAQL
ncbi:uncharacterized protein ARMOST_10142 [Armillaria ostoyae]|uniref:Thioredoxin domain-containing protein n=1 Tax=Armillaria ostoyae TaxID=47428 RepID=A0A284RDH8_ARMOS|nr:uncharacterized protein ARMOST_10142 [Armillaria ostoyae]